MKVKSKKCLGAISNRCPRLIHPKVSKLAMKNSLFLQFCIPPYKPSDHPAFAFPLPSNSCNYLHVKDNQLNNSSENLLKNSISGLYSHKNINHSDILETAINKGMPYNSRNLSFNSIRLKQLTITGDQCRNQSLKSMRLNESLINTTNLNKCNIMRQVTNIKAKRLKKSRPISFGNEIDINPAITAE